MWNSYTELLRHLFRESDSAALGFRERIFGADATAQSMADHRPEVEKYVWFTTRKPERLWFKSIVQPRFCVSGPLPPPLPYP